MDLSERIRSFALLGNRLQNLLIEGSDEQYSYEFMSLIRNQESLNEWFTLQNVTRAIKAIAAQLTEPNIITWTNAYPALREEADPLRVGLIMAGNIPLVGFHDFLSVLITGNNVIAKTSSKDSQLIRFLSDQLYDINPSFRDKIEITNDTLKNFDIVIATGSDNSARYFDYYFNKYPNIIRKNRNSIAIIDGSETEEELTKLGDDVFSYFGLGCRNVSKIFIPEGYSPDKLTRHWSVYNNIVHHRKYSNNYDFNKAVYLVNREPFFDTGYILLKEDARIASPVSVLHYEYYDSLQNIHKVTEQMNEKIQCIIGRNYIPFGEAQSPHLWDYADGIDTLEFLLKKKSSGIL
jgi:hypothetical protein